MGVLLKRKSASILLGDGTKDVHVNHHLAVALGLNEAVVLTRIHGWLLSNERLKKWDHYRDGHWWTYGSLRYWQQTAFPYWKVGVLRGALERLVERGILITANYNKMRSDRTIWYSIDYAEMSYQLSGYLDELDETEDVDP